MKLGIQAIGNIFNQIDTNFDNCLLKLERKVCGGKTVDERLDQMDNAVVGTTKRVATNIKDTVSNSNVPSAFHKCMDKLPTKPKAKPAPQVVKAIPTTMYCPFCREIIPVEANFCPICKGQITVPVVGVSKAVPTACKIKGMPTVEVVPGKRTIGNKIKSALTCNVSLLTKPFAKVKGSITNV